MGGWTCTETHGTERMKQCRKQELRLPVVVVRSEMHRCNSGCVRFPMGGHDDSELLVSPCKNTFIPESVPGLEGRRREGHHVAILDSASR